MKSCKVVYAKARGAHPVAWLKHGKKYLFAINMTNEKRWSKASKARARKLLFERAPQAGVVLPRGCK